MQQAYDDYRSHLLRRARRIVVDPDLAEEAVQEAFVRAWQNCSTFDPGAGPVLNWLVVITRNIAIDLVKARTRRPSLSSTTNDEGAPDERARLSDVDRVVLRDQLSDLLAAIGPDHRAAVVETILRDRPYDDVAADFGVPNATLRTRVHYALRRLRELIEASDESACAGQAT